MNGFTAYLENALLNTLRGRAYSTETLYLALFTSPASDVAPGAEIADPAYARQKITFGAVVQQDAGSAIQNSADLVFPVATQDWGAVTDFGVFDSLTGGNMLFYGQLTAAKPIESNETLRFMAGQVTLKLG